MDYINRIRDIYKGNILLHAPYKGKKAESIPEQLYSLLCASNGIKETMFHPETGEKLAIMWVLYPYDMMIEETAFYNAEYNIEGGCIRF